MSRPSGGVGGSLPRRSPVHTDPRGESGCLFGVYSLDAIMSVRASPHTHHSSHALNPARQIPRSGRVEITPLTICLIQFPHDFHAQGREERRLIPVTEFDANFKGKRIQVLWPDTDTWYNAEVLKVNVKARTATLYYTDTKEKEDINLYEAMLNMEVSWPLRGAAVGTKAATSSKRKGSSDDDSDDEPSPAPPRKEARQGCPQATRQSAAPGGNARRVVLGKFAEALRAAQRETSERTGDDPNILAETLEEALHDACADGKEYALKGRSLAFNLNHEKNPGSARRCCEGTSRPRRWRE